MICNVDYVLKEVHELYSVMAVGTGGGGNILPSVYK